MFKDEIREQIMTLNLGYKWAMSDYATSTEEENQIEKDGLEQVEIVVDKLNALMEDLYYKRERYANL